MERRHQSPSVFSALPPREVLVVFGALIVGAAGLTALFILGQQAATTRRAAATASTLAAPTPKSRAATDRAASPPGDFVSLDWGTLTSYKYERGVPNLPAAIRALDGRRVALSGFLTCLDEYEDIHRFFLVANHLSCCYGIPPGPSGIVYVEVAARDGLALTTNGLRITGTFRAREVMKDDYMIAIWSILDANVESLE